MSDIIKKSNNLPDDVYIETIDRQYADSIFLQTNIVPTITPLTREGDIDIESIPKYLTHLYTLGVKAILVMGLTGEFNRLDNLKRIQAIKVFTENNQKRFCLFVNATGDTEDETIANVRTIEKYNIDGLVLAPLYYLNNSTEIIPHLQKLKVYGL
jgi:4-hydroxy-tetrahydrodipicolinate synthase